MDITQLREQILRQIEQLPKEQAEALKQQIEAMSDEELLEFIKQQSKPKCFFCEVLEGKVDIKIIKETKNWIVFLDAFPALIGHALIVLKTHKSFNELNEAEFNNFFDLIKKLEKAYKEIGFDGFNLILSEGKSAGQNFQHLVFHFIPRKTNDGVVFGWQKIEASESDLDNFREKIKKILEELEKLEIEEKKEKKVKSKSEIEKISKLLKERKP